MNFSLLLEWSAVIMGTIGTIIWASKSKYSKYCGIIWIVGSFLWVIFALRNKHFGLAINNLVYILLYSYGIYKWVVLKEVSQNYETALNLEEKEVALQPSSVQVLLPSVSTSLTQVEITQTLKQDITPDLKPGLRSYENY